jgi:eukaryotic-like serine/threonine-protein kinase
MSETLPYPGPSSDADFELARRAVERGLLTRDQVESAIARRDESPSSRLLDLLPLTPEALRSLQSEDKARPLPPEVQAVAGEAARRIGKYVVVAPLGAGGMGVVVKAYDTVLCRYVALKFLKAVGDERAGEYFEREARLAASLSHPNIASIYEVGQNDGKNYIALQYIDGRTLHAGRKRLTLPQIVRAMKEASEAVDYAHRQGIVHRDLKPANLMIDQDGRVFVMDFGLAKQTEVEGGASGLSGSNIILGTPGYMSPEQARGALASVDRVSDVYSLGATLYDLLTGRAPFDGTSQAEILVGVLQTEPTPPRRLRPDLPRDLETIALKCLEKDRARRYSSARELAEELQRYLNDEPITARPPSITYRLTKRVARHPVASLLTVLLLLVVPTGGYYTWKAIREARERGRVEKEKLALEEESERRKKALDITASALEVWQSVAPLVVQAEARSRTGELEPARALLREGIAICKRSLAERDSAHVHFFLARLYSGLGLSAEASSEIEASLAREPNLAEARHERGFERLKEYARSLDRARLSYAAFNMRSAAGSQAAAGNSAPAGKSGAAEAKEKDGGEASVEQLEAAYPELSDQRKKVEADLSVPVKASSYFRPADILLGKAELARLRQRLAEAAQFLDQAAAEDSQHVGVLLSRARLAKDNRDLKSAVDFAKRASKSHKGLSEFARTAADLLVDRSEELKDIREQKALLLDAAAEADRAVALNEREAESWACRSRVRASLGKLESTDAGQKALWEQSLSDIEQAIRLEPRNTRLLELLASRHYDLFALRFDMGDEKARPVEWHADYEKVLEIRPDHPLALSTRAGVYLELAEILSDRTKIAEDLWEKAFEDLDRFVAQFPQSATPYNYRGSVRRRHGEALRAAERDPRPDFERAAEDYSRALERDARLEVCWRNRGIMRADLAGLIPDRAGELRQLAVADFENAHRLLPNQGESINRAGVALYNQAFLEKTPQESSRLMGRAAGYYAQALAVHPEGLNFPRNQALALLWKAHYDLQDRKDPRADFDQALRLIAQGILLNSATPLFWTTRAQILEEIASFEEKAGIDPSPRFRGIVQDCSAALGLDPENREGLERRARGYLALARLERSKDRIEKAALDRAKLVRGDPVNSVRVKDLGWCWEESAKLFPDEAIAFHERAAEVYRRAVGRRVGLPGMHSYVGSACWSKAIAEAAAGKDPRPSYAEAWRGATEFAGEQPTAEAFEIRGRILADQSSWESEHGHSSAMTMRRALADFDLAASKDPKRVTVFAHRAQLLTSLAKIAPTQDEAVELFGRSIRDFTTALEGGFEPLSEVYAERGLTAVLLGIRLGGGEKSAKEYWKAVADYAQAEKLAPTDARFPRSRSRTFFWLQKTMTSQDQKLNCARLGVASARQAVKLEPSVESYSYLGEALTLLGDLGVRTAYSEAIDAYERGNAAGGKFQSRIADLKGKADRR